MNETFSRLYRQLQIVVASSLIAAASVFGVAFLAALGGFKSAAESLARPALYLGGLFVGLLGLFMVATLVAAIVGWLNRPHDPTT